MTREVSRENSQDAQDKDPRAVRPDKRTNAPLSNVERQKRFQRKRDEEIKSLRREVAELRDRLRTLEFPLG